MKKISLSRVNKVFLFLVLLTIILYYGKEVLIVLVFSIFLAMLMTPLSNRLENIGVNRIFSTIISVLIIVLILAGILWLITAQVVAFSEELPQIQAKFEKLLASMQAWFEKQFGISPKQQIEAVSEQAKNVISGAGTMITGFIGGTVSLVGSFLLVIVFTFLFLLSRDKYERFFLLLNHSTKNEETLALINKIGKVAQQYLTGRVVSIVILTIFYTIGLLIVGIKNAFMLSAIAALVTFIPYVGPIIGGIFPLFMAIVTEDSFGPALGVIIVLSLAQAFDNYFVEPLIVGGNINISPFFTIFILIVGGLVWGIAGVILFLPMLGIVKIIFDNIESLQPFGYLIGDQKTNGGDSKSFMQKVKERFSKK